MGAPHDEKALSQLCTRCGSDRLLSLSFGAVNHDDRHPNDDDQPEVSEPPERPVKKCVACGQQLYARDLAQAPPAST
jgi:hypothetical protein